MEKLINTKNNINTGVYFRIVDKKLGQLYVKISISNDMNYDINNLIITDYFLVEKVNDFYNFLINHSYLINLKKDDANNYILTEKDYKNIIKIAKLQHVYYVTIIKLNSDNFNNYIVKNININRGNKIQKYKLFLRIFRFIFITYIYKILYIQIQSYHSGKNIKKTCF
jgi:hypothetical protein